ncbi:TPA: hypothetical protein I7303_23440 [Vibrio parahaemolyticus]|nr:hypothetical protein [Vibrio parahaemolyticus]
MLEKKDLPLNILEYLNETRFDIPLGSSANSSAQILYGNTIQYIESLILHLKLKASFCIIYTDSFKSEVVQHSNENYIIHDRAFGQCINMLNRIFLYDCSDETSKIYMHKLISQMSSRYGFFNESVFLGNKYKSFKNRMNHKEKQGNSRIHTKYTEVQELFVLLHEIGHLSLNNETEFNVSVHEDVRCWLIEHQKVESDNSTDYSVLSGHEDIDLSKFDKYLHDSKLNTKTIVNNEKMVEEFSADRLAFLYLLPNFNERTNLDKVDLIKSIVLCFLHLRAIQLLEYSLSTEENDSLYDRKKEFSLDVGLTFRFYNMRLQHIKHFMYDLLEIKSEERTTIDNQVSEIMYKHTDLILEPCFGVFNAVFYDRKFRNRYQKDFIRISKKMPKGIMTKRAATALLHLV